MIKFLPLGGADDIGASCFYLNINNTGILLDCGTHPRKDGKDAIPDFSQIENQPLDFVFISHAHQDHIGALPFLIKKFPHTIIHTTLQTKEIADLTLHNAINIISRKSNKHNELEFYTHEEVDLLVKSIRENNYDEFIQIRGLRHSGPSDIKIKFFDAGHILGASMIYIEHDATKILYTGDVNFSNQSIMMKSDLSMLSNINVLISESTYGSTDSLKLGTWHSESVRLAKSINQIIQKGGSVLIPVFALGKTQEILSTLYQLMKKGTLVDVPIFTSGIGRDISKLYDKNRYIVRRRNPNLVLQEIPQRSIKEITDLNYFTKNPSIVLASSGMMMEGTESFRLAEFWLKHENLAIYSVGYMDADSPGSRIMNSNTSDSIQLNEFGKAIDIKCQLKKFYFPSHAKREDLLQIVEAVNPKTVVLVHGEEQSKNWIGDKILKKYNHIKVFSAKNHNELIF